METVISSDSNPDDEIEYEMAKGLPVPEPLTGTHARGKSKYPWPKMQPGDSVHIRGRKKFERARKAMQSFKNNARRRGKLTDRDFQSRLGFYKGVPDPNRDCGEIHCVKPKDKGESK